MAKEMHHLVIGDDSFEVVDNKAREDLEDKADVSGVNGNFKAQDFLIKLDETAEAGTTDGDLYAAIQALGWEDDVIDNLSNIILKKVLVKLTEEKEQLNVPATNCDSIDMMRIGNVVMVKFLNIKSLPTGNTNIYVLPEDYRPRIAVSADFSNPQKTNQLRLTIATNGTVSVYNYGSSATSAFANVSGIFTYLWSGKDNQEE